MKTSEKGQGFIKTWEVLELEAYQDQAGVWTIGYGTTRYPEGNKVKAGDKISPQGAEELFQHDLQSFEGFINRQNLRLSQQQFDALVAFVYNVGASSFLSSTLLKVLRRNPDDLEAVRAQFVRWVYITDNGKKKISNGLVNRRAHEFKIYKSADYERKY